tara:strand:+ start:87 stop:1028 length:942 start_codon:yes stop_codon:yes gene_type:complete
VNDILKTLGTFLKENDYAVSIGGIGAIAEYEDPIFQLEETETLLIISSKNKNGAMRAKISQDFGFVAKETLSNKSRLWNQEININSTEHFSEKATHRVLRELGKDANPLEETHKDHILFDLGVGLRNSLFCIRTCHDELIALMRGYIGKKITTTQHPILEAIVDVSPTRVVSSKIGRIEVYQKISRVRTPKGPHTHLLPELLNVANKRFVKNSPSTDSLPMITFYPKRRNKRDPYGIKSCQNFNRLLRIFGDKDYYRAKNLAISGLLKNDLAENLKCFQSSIEKTALKITLLQSKHYFPSQQLAKKCLLRFPT